MIWALLFLAVVAAQTTRDIARSVATINAERRRFGVPPIKYNLAAQSSLEELDPDYWFNKSTTSIHEFQLGPFNRTRQYNLYFHIAPAGMRYLFHDSMRESMADIMNFRAKQRNCFKLRQCSKTLFSMFYTCGGRPSHVQNSRPCSWFFHYYPRMILRSLKQIVCVIVERQGPDVPAHLLRVQKKVFVCYGTFETPDSDYPV